MASTAVDKDETRLRRFSRKTEGGVIAPHNACAVEPHKKARLDCMPAYNKSTADNSSFLPIQRRKG